MASSASQFYLVMGKIRTPEDLKKYEDRINKAAYARCARAFIASEEGHKLKLAYNSYKSSGQTDSASVINQKIEEAVMKEYSKKPEYKFSPYQVETLYHGWRHPSPRRVLYGIWGSD